MNKNLQSNGRLAGERGARAPLGERGAHRAAGRDRQLQNERWLMMMVPPTQLGVWKSLYVSELWHITCIMGSYETFEYKVMTIYRTRYRDPKHRAISAGGGDPRSAQKRAAG